MQTIFMSTPVSGVLSSNSLGLNKKFKTRENPRAPDGGDGGTHNGDRCNLQCQRGAMLYKFKSRVASDLIMLEPNGRQVLEILGKEPGQPGIIEAVDALVAVQVLEAAVVREEAAQKAAIEAALAKGEPAPRFEGVSLRQRVVPLIDMLRRSEKAGKEVVWGV
jgi:hypothetical protein